MWTALTFGIIAVLVIVAVGFWICKPNRNESDLSILIHAGMMLPGGDEIMRMWLNDQVEAQLAKQQAEFKRGMERDLIGMTDRDGLAITSEDQ